MKQEFALEKMLLYMERKYGEVFDFIENYGGQAGCNYKMILVKSRKFDERRALVRLREGNGRDCFEDNYLAFLLKAELEKLEGGLARQCFGDCKLYFKLPEFVFPSSFKADMTAEQFLKDPYSMPRFSIYPALRARERQRWEEIVRNFGRKNGEKGYKMRGVLSIAATDRDYEMINESNFISASYEDYTALDELIFSLDQNGGFRYLRWLSGNE